MAEFVLLDGTNDYITSPDHASFDITGDLDLRACVRLTDWSSVVQTFVSKWLTENSYLFRNAATGELILQWRDAAGTFWSATSTAAVAFANAADGWVRVTLDVNNGSNQREAKFYTSTQSPDTDPASVSWTQLGTTITGTVTDIRVTTARVDLGVYDGTSGPLNGRYYYAEVRNGIGGSLVANPDFRDTGQADSETQFTDSPGRVWTLTSGADWSGTIGSSEYVDLTGAVGTYISTPDHATLDISGDLDLRCYVALDDWEGNTTREYGLISKWAATNSTNASFRWWKSITALSHKLVIWDSVGNAELLLPTSSTFTSPGDGNGIWLRVTLDVNNGSSQRVTTYYTSTDPLTTDPASVSWTQLSQHTEAGVVAINLTNSSVLLGAEDSGNDMNLLGHYYYAEIRNGIAGTIVANPDFRDADQADSETQFTDSQTRVWTLQGAADWTGSLTGPTDLTVTWRPFDFVFYPHRDSASVSFIIELPSFDFVIDAQPWTVTAGAGNVVATWRPFNFVVDADLWTVSTQQLSEPPPPPPPLPVLTTEDILSSLSLSITVGLELLDANDSLIADISGDMEKTGWVARNMTAEIHGTARFRLSRALNWHNQRLRPYLTITDTISGVFERFDLGIYLPETPSRRSGQTPHTYEVEAYDKLVVLQNPHGIAFTAAAGAGVVETVESLLDAFGLAHDLAQSAVVLPTARSWPLDSQNTTLRIVNELLESIGYRALYVDRLGVFRAQAYRAPEAQGPIWHYDSASERTTVGAEMQEEIDLFAVPNWWVFVRDDPGQDPPSEGNGIYTVVNHTDGPTSINYRGRVVRKVVRVDAADHASLVALGDQIVQRDRQPIAELEFTSVPNPLHWHADSITVSSPEFGFDRVIFGEVAWSIPLDGGDMSHRARRAVSV